MSLLQLQLFYTIGLLIFAIVWLQSGISKLIDFKGELTYFNQQFKSTWGIKHMVKESLILITLLEVGSGLLQIAAVYSLWTNQDLSLSYWAILTSLLTLFTLITGQRMAKDYAGAQGIMVYITAALAFLYILQALGLNT